METVDPFDDIRISADEQTPVREEPISVEISRNSTEADGVQLGAPLTVEARNAAIEVGRQIGERDADERGEEGALREGRIKRAMAYAAWEFDGKPVGRGVDYESEFGIGVLGELRQAVGHSGPDFKSGQKKKGEK